MAELHWQCQLTKLDTKGESLGDTPLTVGQTFNLNCEGPEVAGLVASASSIELPKEQEYALKILKNLGVDTHHASFVATSYLVNDKGHDFKNIFLSDGKTRVALDGINFKVKSVITKENNPKNEPFPPMGPFGFQYPSWIWIGFVIIFIFVVSLALEKILERVSRRRFLKLLASNPPVLSPYHQFSKELRHSSREHLSPQQFNPDSAKLFLTELNQQYRWYLSRTLLIPSFDASASHLSKLVKAKMPDLYKRLTRSFTRSLVELERWQVRSQQLTLNDATQLLEMVRAGAEELEKNVTTKTEARASRSRLEAEV